MSEQPEDNNLLNFIAATVETMRDQMATKSDLEPLRDQVEYLGGQVESMRDRMATKEDLAGVATKADLTSLEARLTDKLEVEIIAVRGDIEQIHLRLDSIDRALSARLGQIETEMSRLRSVVYLLAKDRPELLRLLGQTPPPGV
ncbi:MAG TPA: hypothetical protein VF240_07305 [Pyrinomonadaceae bacterium]